nr:reverse transcriptase domain-containing protein [Tanacetum cinerariifolium]
MVNVFSPDHVHDLPKVKPNQLVPALVDENEEPEEEEFKDEEEFEEEETQEEKEDMEVDIGEEENEPELIFPYVEVDPINLPQPALDLESKDVVKVEDMVEPEDETVLNSVYVVGQPSTTTFLREDSNSLLPSFMRRNINSLFSQIASLTTRVIREREAVLEDIIKEFSNAKERVECKKLKKELEEARVNEALTAHRDRRVNVSGASGSRQGEAPTARECTFSGFMKCNLIVFHCIDGAVELQRWFEKTEMVFEISNYAEGKKLKFTATTLQGPALTWWNTKVATIGLEAENVKVDAYLKGLSENIKGEGHTRNHCSKKNKPQGGNASGRAYVIKDVDKQGPNVVTVTFLLNNHYASVLFDLGSDKSFVNTRSSHLIDINPDKLDVSYKVELANGKVVSTNTMLRGCTLNLVNQLLKIDLMPI